MSYRYVNANDVVDIVDIETQNKINEMDCVYIDGIKPNNQHFNLADHDKRIRDEVVDEFALLMKEALNHDWATTKISDMMVYNRLFDKCNEIAKQIKGGAENE